MTTRPIWLLLAMLALAPRPVFAAPEAATLITPSGEVNGSTVAFSWQSVSDSTWYLFWLGKGSPTAFVMQQWFTADQAGCAAGGTCTILLTPPINAGGHTWFVQTWAAGATGPWSTGKVFVFKDPTPTWSSFLPSDRRFTLVLNAQGVLDHETGLVWERTPLAATYAWNAQPCVQRQILGRYGWRVPTIAELASLLDVPGAGNLPAGHPFVLGAGGPFWSATTTVADVTYALQIGAPGLIGASLKTVLDRFWCVRGPTGGTQ